MANEERFSAPKNPQSDRADEVQRRVDVTPPPPQPPMANAREGALFPSAETTRLRNQWTDIQGAFVDEPKSAVKRADALVGEVLKSLSDSFARERSTLESQWDRDGNVTTEDFRVALRRYREFFDRLLSL